MGINVEWTGYNCPEQNAHVEREIGTLKMDWLWIQECDRYLEAQALVDRAVRDYNEEHPHSSLFFLNQEQFRQAY
jgi:transposase InsO family protein